MFNLDEADKKIMKAINFEKVDEKTGQYFMNGLLWAAEVAKRCPLSVSSEMLEYANQVSALLPV